jgi:putative membrane protein
MNILHLVVTWLVTAIGLVVVSKLPTGVEIDTFGKALLSAVVFGLLNAFISPVLKTLSLPLEVIFSTFLVSLVVNLVIFGLAAFLVQGFRLRWGLWSALLGSFALSVLTSLIYKILPF